jgi:DNA modification methylase
MKRRPHRNSNSSRTAPRRGSSAAILSPESEDSSSTSDRLTTQPSARGYRLKIVERRIEDIKPDPRNPRIHSRKQIRKLAGAIREFGFNTPLLLGSGAKLLAGHARLEACKLLGLSVLPTISLEHLTEAQARAFIISDNRLSEISEWDDRLLAEHLKDLSEMALDFSIELTGFEMGEIDLRIEGLNCGAEGEADPADAIVEAIPEDRCVTRPNDCWLLGEHRVLCANALDENAYAALLEGKKASVVISDPPYNRKIANVSGLGAVQHREFAMASGEMTNAEFTLFLTQVCSRFARHATDGSLHYLFVDWRGVGEMLAAGRIAYSELKNIAVWVKSNAGMGSFYRSQHELIAIFKSDSGSHRNNVQLGSYGRNRTNVWNYPNVNFFGRAGEERNFFAHPTPKPVAMLADAIMDSTGRGDVVVDGFLGSGSTLIAAERTGRRCYGIEIDTLYVDLIVRRWQAFTRDRARHAVTGLCFDDTQTEGDGKHAK